MTPLTHRPLALPLLCHGSVAGQSCDEFETPYFYHFSSEIRRTAGADTKPTQKGHNALLARFQWQVR